MSFNFSTVLFSSPEKSRYTCFKICEGDKLQFIFNLARAPFPKPNVRMSPCMQLAVISLHPTLFAYSTGFFLKYIDIELMRPFIAVPFCTFCFTCYTTKSILFSESMLKYSNLPLSSSIDACKCAYGFFYLVGLFISLYSCSFMLYLSEFAESFSFPTYLVFLRFSAISVFSITTVLDWSWSQR